MQQFPDGYISPPLRRVCFNHYPCCPPWAISNGLSTCTLIRLHCVDSVEIPVESCHARPELGQHARFFPRQWIIQLSGGCAWMCGIHSFGVFPNFPWQAFAGACCDIEGGSFHSGNQPSVSTGTEYIKTCCNGIRSNTTGGEMAGQNGWAKSRRRTTG